MHHDHLLLNPHHQADSHAGYLGFMYKCSLDYVFAHHTGMITEQKEKGKREKGKGKRDVVGRGGKKK